jgi:hypothetical protein
MGAMGWNSGACVVDTRTGRVGRVMGHVGPYLRLRPLVGGQEWHCPPDTVREAMEWEQRNADVLDANWRFWRRAAGL